MKNFKSNEKKIHLNANILGLKSIELDEKYLNLNNHGYNININEVLNEEYQRLTLNQKFECNRSNYLTGKYDIYMEFYGLYLGGGKKVTNVESKDIVIEILHLLNFFNHKVSEIKKCNHNFINTKKENLKNVKCEKCNVEGNFAPFFIDFKNESDNKTLTNISVEEKQSSINLNDVICSEQIDFILDIEFEKYQENNRFEDSLTMYGLIRNKGLKIYKKSFLFNGMFIIELASILLNEKTIYDDDQNFMLARYIFCKSVINTKSRDKLNYSNLKLFMDNCIDYLDTITYYSNDFDISKSLISKMIDDYFNNENNIDIIEKPNNNLISIINYSLILSIDNFINS